MAQPHTPLGLGVLFVGEGAVGVEVEPGLLDQPGGVDGADLVRGGCDQPVREQRRLEAEVAGVLGHHPGPPGGHPPRTGQVPQPGQPVRELQGVTDQLLRRVQREPRAAAEVGRRELRHPGCTLAGERGDLLVVQVQLTEVGGRLIGRAGVQPGPRQRHLQLTERGPFRVLASLARSVDHLAGGEGDRGVHGQNLEVATDSFDSVFEIVDKYF